MIDLLGVRGVYLLGEFGCAVSALHPGRRHARAAAPRRGERLAELGVGPQTPCTASAAGEASLRVQPGAPDPRATVFDQDVQAGRDRRPGRRRARCLLSFYLYDSTGA